MSILNHLMKSLLSLKVVSLGKSILRAKTMDRDKVTKGVFHLQALTAKIGKKNRFRFCFSAEYYVCLYFHEGNVC